MNPPIDDEPTNGIRHRRDTLRPVEDEEEPRVERRQSKSWGDLLDPKTMLLIGVAVLSGNGSRLGEMLGLAAPVRAEAPAESERVAKLEVTVDAHSKAIETLVGKVENVDKNVTTLLERVPARRQR